MQNIILGTHVSTMINIYLWFHPEKVSQLFSYVFRKLYDLIMKYCRCGFPLSFNCIIILMRISKNP